MKIGFMTSWAEKCGISEYSRNLVYGLIRSGHEVVVAANYPKSQLEPDQDYVKRFFHCPFMTNETTADTCGMLSYFKDIDILHVQFEASLYHPSWFEGFLSSLVFDAFNMGRKVPIVLTMHSVALWDNSKVPQLADRFILHEPLFQGPKFVVIPMPIDFQPDDVEPNYKKIITFGLGRNLDDKVYKAIEGTKLEFHRHFGHQHGWITQQELYNEIKKSWVVSLIYPVLNFNTSSSAVTMAMACNRPVMVTPTNWFNHVQHLPNLYPCYNDQDIRHCLEYLTDPNNLSEIKERMALGNEQIYHEKRTLPQVIETHINLYKELTCV